MDKWIYVEHDWIENIFKLLVIVMILVVVRSKKKFSYFSACHGYLALLFQKQDLKLLPLLHPSICLQFCRAWSLHLSGLRLLHQIANLLYTAPICLVNDVHLIFLLHVRVAKNTKLSKAKLKSVAKSRKGFNSEDRRVYECYCTITYF